MKQPFFSIVIPVLNEEAWLPRLLKDLTRQTMRSFEVLVVDGGSSDGTINEARKFSHQLPLQHFESEANVGKQRNIGVQHALGRYLVFLDADVQVSPKYLHLLRQGISASPGHFYTTWIKPDSRNLYDKAIAKFINLGMEISVVIEKPVVAGFQMIVSKEAFMKVKGFREDIRHAEDVDLAHRLSDAGFAFTVLRTPMLTFSLRRHRVEGRLRVIRKHAQAGLHLLTNGPITRDIFHYPMGGGWYKTYKRESLTKQGLATAERYMKRLVKLFLE